MKFTVNNITVELVDSDITELATDAITNAANSQLVLGAGVAGAIRRKGGPSIQSECDQIGYCEVGSAVITGGGNLPAKYVIHAVGPRMGEGNEHQKLSSAIQSVLTVAEANKLSSVAIPAISTGIFGFPKKDCAEIMITEIQQFTETSHESLKYIIVCLWGDADYQIFVEIFKQALEN